MATTQSDRAPARTHDEGRRGVQRSRLRSGGRCPPSRHDRLSSPGWPSRSTDREAHAEAMQQFLRSFPDMHVDTPYPIQFGSGDWITVVTHATGTFTGELPVPDGNVIPATGKAFDVEFGQTSKWDGDQLIVISAFWDAALQATATRPCPVNDGSRPTRQPRRFPDPVASVGVRILSSARRTCRSPRWRKVPRASV